MWRNVYLDLSHVSVIGLSSHEYTILTSYTNTAISGKVCSLN